MKRVFRIICLALCLLGTASCTDKKPPLEDLLSYDKFLLCAMTYGWYTSFQDMSEDVKKNEAEFRLLSSDDFERTSIEMEFDTDEVVKIGYYGEPGIIHKDEQIVIHVIYALDVTFDYLPCVLRYTTTTGEVIEKSYTLDFTQEPYRGDFRPYWDKKSQEAA